MNGKLVQRKAYQTTDTSNTKLEYRYNNENNSQHTRYIIKEEKYHAFDRKLVQEAVKIVNNMDFKGGEEKLDKTLSTILSTESDLEKFVDTFAEALQSVCRKTFKTISTKNKIRKRNQSPDVRTASRPCGKG